MLRARGISMLAEFAHILSYLGKEVTILETVVFLGMFLHDIPYNFKTMDCRMIWICFTQASKILWYILWKSWWYVTIIIHVVFHPVPTIPSSSPPAVTFLWLQPQVCSGRPYGWNISATCAWRGLYSGPCPQLLGTWTWDPSEKANIDQWCKRPSSIKIVQGKHDIRELVLRWKTPSFWFAIDCLKFSSLVLFNTEPFQTNVNPWLINPGWLIAMVPQNNSIWPLEWHLPQINSLGVINQGLTL